MTDLVNSLNESLQLSIPSKAGREDLIRLLTEHINNLLNSDFEKLVSLLYRLDISEKKIRECLAVNAGQDAAPLIAQLIIERQEQKIKSRQQYTRRDQSIDEEDAW
jgi:DNA-directed RNA polymerase specialized sigma54-like protein